MSKRYQTYSERLQSYQGWPRNYIAQTPEILAAAGFFYIGSADRVSCFSCHKTLRNWQPGQDPLTSHKTVSPACSFVKSMTSYENRGTFQSSTVEPDGEGSSSDKGRENLEVDEYEFPASKTINYAFQGTMEGAFASEVKDIIKYCRNFQIDSNTPSSVLTKTNDKYAEFNKNDNSEVGQKYANEGATCRAVNHWSKKEQLRQLKEENEMLKRKRLCKSCYKSESNILVLPCSHIELCDQCVEKFTSCAKCGRRVMGTVKVFWC